MFFCLLCLLTISSVYGGTKCPDRKDIYPCICVDKPIGKSFETMIICQGLKYGGSLKAIEEGLSLLEIEKFLLYDSYWSADPGLLQENGVIPVNYPTSFRTVEVKIVDSILSSFACPERDNCRTSYLKSFAATNSTVTACSNHSSINEWISCPQNIEFIEINGGYSTNTALKSEFFPDPLHKLKELHLINNRISKLERRTFTNIKFPVLEILDLSHNFLREFLLLSALPIKHLDLSYNHIRTVLDLQYFPQLKYMNLSNNNILHLLQHQWQNIPENLRTIDLNNNNLDCNCSVKWINSTFHISTNLLGHCSTPPQVAAMKIRRASRLLNQRCDENGQISATRIHQTTTSAPGQ